MASSVWREVWLLLMVERWREDQVTLQERYNTKVTTESGKKQTRLLPHAVTLITLNEDYLNTNLLDLIMNCRLSKSIAKFVDVSVVLVTQGFVMVIIKVKVKRYQLV